MSNVPLNTSLRPIPAGERVLGLSDHIALWGSLGVGLLVIQAGSFLVPALSLSHALGAIAIGTLIGTLLLAWVGRLGAQSGVASAGLIWSALGRRFATLPIGLNVLQLIGWSVFEIVVLRDGLGAIAKHLYGPVSPALLTVLVGVLLVGLLSLSMVGIVRKLIRRVGLWLMLGALGFLTWRYTGEAAAAGWDKLWARPGTGGMGFGAAIDLAIVMPISWLPLIADYTRYSRSAKEAFGGTLLGYGIANAWCFALGTLIIALHPGGELMGTLLLAGGGALALGLVLVDEVDNGYSDLYSASVSGHSLLPRLSVRVLGPLLAVLATVIALSVPIQHYQDFLYLLGSVFVPLFGVVIAYHGKSPKVDFAKLPAISWPGALAWFAGIGVYQWVSHNAPTLGASLPSLVAAFVLYHVLAKPFGMRQAARA
ncbi:cytosine permease [Neisseriaceae bacterium JH1-16]|nr:cytosine permease [Neisseriaceae bacterium JH1-16]